MFESLVYGRWKVKINGKPASYQEVVSVIAGIIKEQRAALKENEEKA